MRLVVFLGCFLIGNINLSGQGLPQELITVEAGTWRSATIFTHAIWKDLLFYGGGSGSNGGDPRHEIEIGVFHLTAPDAGYHNPKNPIVTREQFDLDHPGRGITPLSILDRGDSLFMFCTSRPDSDLQPRIVLISASVDDPFSWSGYKVLIDKAFSGLENNHGASVLVDPDHPERLLVYFAARSSQIEYRILLATVPADKVSDPGAYHLLNDYHNPVLVRDKAKVNYPFIQFDQKSGEFTLWYSGQTIGNPATRSCYRTVSKQKDMFQPAVSSVIDASGIPGRNDGAYATGPKIHNDYLYYSGRREAMGDYRSIFCIALDRLDQL